jgi:hypothetical protein
MKLYLTSNLNKNLPSLINSLKDFQIDASSKTATGKIALKSDLKEISQISESEDWNFLHFGMLNDGSSPVSVKITLKENLSDGGSAIIQIVVSVVFGFLGLVALLYGIFWVMKKCREIRDKSLELTKPEFKFYFPMIINKAKIPKDEVCPVCKGLLILEPTRIIPRSEAMVHSDCLWLHFMKKSRCPITN